MGETKSSGRAPRGAWAAYNPQNRAEVASCGSEIAAYRLGNPRGWLVVSWPFGLTLDEAIAKVTPVVPEVAAEPGPEPGSIVAGKKREL